MQIFETVLIKKDDWKVTLVTERTPAGVVKSYLKVHFVANGVPRVAQQCWSHPGYLHTVKVLKNHILQPGRCSPFEMYWKLGHDYGQDLVELLKEGFEQDAFDKKIIEHNRKTKHQPHLLKGHSFIDKELDWHLFDVYEDKDLGVKLWFKLTSEKAVAKLSGCIQFDGLVCNLDIDHFFESGTSLIDSRSVQNTVVMAIAASLNRAYSDVDDRKEVISGITKWFDESQVGINYLLNKLNKEFPVRTATKC